MRRSLNKVKSFHLTAKPRWSYTSVSSSPIVTVRIYQSMLSQCKFMNGRRNRAAIILRWPAFGVALIKKTRTRRSHDRLAVSRACSVGSDQVLCVPFRSPRREIFPRKTLSGLLWPKYYCTVRESRYHRLSVIRSRPRQSSKTRARVRKVKGVQPMILLESLLLSAGSGEADADEALNFKSRRVIPSANWKLL